MNIVNLENDSAVKQMRGDDSLLDGFVSSIEIKNDSGQIYIIVSVNMRPSSQYRRVKLLFSNVTRYDFVKTKYDIIGDIASVKFKKARSGSYCLSLDPDDSSFDFTDGDGDLIEAKTVNVQALYK